MRTYFVKDWDTHFENSESRKVKVPRWVAVPNRHDGKGYRRVLKHPRAVEIFCAWCLIIQVASKTPVRGILSDHDGPLTDEDLADATGYPRDIFAIAFQVLSSPAIGWISYEDATNGVNSSPDVSGYHPGTSGRAGVEGKGREDRGGNTKTPPYPPTGGECDKKADGPRIAGRPPACEGQSSPPPAEMRDSSGDEDAPKGANGWSPPAEVTRRGGRTRRNGESQPEDATADAPKRAPAAGDAGKFPPGFVRFWSAYPASVRKVGKTQCLRLWKRAGLETMADRVIAALSRSRASRDWNREAGAYVPMPSTWLNRTPWETDPAEQADGVPVDEDRYSPGFVPRRYTAAELDEMFGPPEAPKTEGKS
jgi:hypothetical protein